MNFIWLIVLYVVRCETSNVTWHKLDNSEFYVATNSSENFDEALSSCTSMGATLAKVNSSNLQTFLATLAVPRKSYYIGLKRKPSSNNFNWLDGSKLTWSSWRSGEPNNHLTSGNEDCVVMGAPWNPSLLWNDYPCHFSVGYICHRSFATDIQTRTRETSGIEETTTVEIFEASTTNRNKDVTYTHKTTNSAIITLGLTSNSLPTEKQNIYVPAILGALIASLVANVIFVGIAIHYRKKFTDGSESQSTLKADQGPAYAERQMAVQYVNVELAGEEKQQSRDYATIGDVTLPPGDAAYQIVRKKASNL